MIGPLSSGETAPQGSRVAVTRALTRLDNAENQLFPVVSGIQATLRRGFEDGLVVVGSLGGRSLDLLYSADDFQGGENQGRQHPGNRSYESLLSTIIRSLVDGEQLVATKDAH